MSHNPIEGYSPLEPLPEKCPMCGESLRPRDADRPLDVAPVSAALHASRSAILFVCLAAGFIALLATGQVLFELRLYLRGDLLWPSAPSGIFVMLVNPLRVVLFGCIAVMLLKYANALDDLETEGPRRLRDWARIHQRLWTIVSGIVFFWAVFSLIAFWQYTRE